MKRNGNNRAIMASKAQIPRGWRLVRLGDVAEVAFSGVDKRTIEGEFPVKLCNYTDVFYNRHIQASMDFMPATATQSELKRWALKQGDVLFTKDSETADEIGIPAFVADDLTNVLCGYHLGLARPSQAMVNGSFLARTLASRASAQEFGRIANGITRFGLTLDATRNLAILLPPLPEQRSIAAVLDSIDDAIERTDAVITATEQLRDSLLHQLLTRGVPGWHTAWKDVPGLGTIPAAWEVVRLGEVAEVVMGQSPPGGKCNRDGDGVPLLNGPTEFGSYYPTPVQWTTDPKKRAGVGDILFCVRGATAGRMNWSDRDYAIGRGIASLKHKGGQAYQRFLRAVIDFRLAELLTVVTGSTFPNLSYDQITQLRVPRVPSPEQQAIADTLEGIDRVLVQRRLERDALRSLKDSTADALLTGLVKAIR